ncbi:hypothetical protein [Tateyamaria sp. ANG-S1]|uniref:hypothetical protein n=1 Tax=Tateyamaria sp. ANG-S1 TaxID=1577905 RepID=UPI001269A90F|nr:hypothetical protein [Tateyamaria sp. ANG-S1]
MDSDASRAQLDDEGTDFTPEELAVFAEVRVWINTLCSAPNPVGTHRLLLGTASELIDAAADLAATRAPGVQVVQLGLLAERVAQLACASTEKDRD